MRKASLTWLETGNGIYPITRQSLEPEELIPDKNLKEQIKKWKKEHHCSDCGNLDVDLDNPRHSTKKQE